ncbi:hypothetical protein [Chryseobacterium tongliaoense]|uniref:hypothetical protein n=1 Tax=Chryseobacterium tongliaoense TaxID=3240933 RepID=UPI0035126829
MKLESLNSSKFEVMTPDEMNKIKGGEAKATGGGVINSEAHGGSVRFTQDCFDVLQDGSYGDMSYLIDGKWYTI